MDANNFNYMLNNGFLPSYQQSHYDTGFMLPFQHNLNTVHHIQPTQVSHHPHQINFEADCSAGSIISRSS
jgi:hypothetical protein